MFTGGHESGVVGTCSPVSHCRVSPTLTHQPTTCLAGFHRPSPSNPPPAWQGFTDPNPATHHLPGRVSPTASGGSDGARSGGGPAAAAAAAVADPPGAAELCASTLASMHALAKQQQQLGVEAGSSMAMGDEAGQYSQVAGWAGEGCSPVWQAFCFLVLVLINISVRQGEAP